MGIGIKSQLQRLDKGEGLSATPVAEKPLLAKPCCRLKRLLQTAAKNFSALIALGGLPRSLISANNHNVLLTHSRIGFISARLGMISIFLAIATITWIPIDIFLFSANWQIVSPLIGGRLVAGLLFLVVGSMPLRSDVHHHGVAAIGSLVGIGIAFYFFAHGLIAAVDEVDLSGSGHKQYLLMPVALAAGIAIFPLTLIEAVAISVVPLLAFLIESLHGDGGVVWAQVSVAAILMCTIMITTATCSVSQLKLLMDLYEQSTIDPLTQMLSRRAGMELLELSFAKSKRANANYVVAMLDLDFFKSVNDCCGHETGDRLLVETGRRLKEGLRRQDALIRWGGEEFLLVLEDADAANAIQRILDLCRHGLSIRPDGSIQTTSIGLAERIADKAQNWQGLVEIADKRLYAAKRMGRDRLNGPAGLSCRLVGERSADADATLTTVPEYVEDYAVDGERDSPVFSAVR